MTSWVKVGRGNHAELVSEERKTLTCATFLFLDTLHCTHIAQTNTTPRKLSLEVSVCLPQPFWPASCEFPLPQHRSGGIFAAAAPTPRCQTFSTRSKCAPSFHHHPFTSPFLHTTPRHLLTLPEQQLWLLTPYRPAFGHLKGSSRTTAPTASDRVISQIASIRKNKDTLNSKPPPSLGSNSGS